MTKRYKVIVKIGNNPDGSAHCLKYRVDDLKKFTAFLEQKWPQWKWFNVYSNSSMDKRRQLANFTKFRRPEKRFV
jgi:hypothetical protein